MDPNDQTNETKRAAVPPTVPGPTPSSDDPYGVSAEEMPYLSGPVRARGRANRSALVWAGGLAALVIILALGFWAVTQRDDAEDARGQTQVFQAEVGQLSEQLAATEAELSAAQSEAASAKAQAETLRGQIEEVGGELDQAAIDRFLVAGEAANLRGLAERGPAVAADVQRCADARTEVGNRAIELLGQPPETPRDAVQTAITDANRICTEAQESVAELEAAVAELDQPPAEQP